MYALWGAYCTWGGDMVESIFHRYCYTSFCFHRHTSIVMLSSYVYHHFLDVTFDEIAFLHLLYLCLPFMPYLISFLFSFYFHQLLTLFIVYMGFSFIVLFSPSFFFWIYVQRAFYILMGLNEITFLGVLVFVGPDVVFPTSFTL